MENTINGDIMKKVIFVICIIVFFCSLNIKSEEIRIRIIANSNSEVDQEIKKELSIYLYENFELDFGNLSECDNYIKNNLENIKLLLNKKFKNIDVSYENHIFYNKTYNNIVSNNEEYKTLLITIGDGVGENFWGVLYSDNFIESTDTIYYKSFILELLKEGKNNV